MPIIGITITKETPFRNSIQPFTNMYFYNNGLGGIPNETGALALIDELVAIEKPFHSAGVEFVYARLWLQTLLQATSVMIAQKALTGVGTVGDLIKMDRERAFLFRWRAGNDSRGNPVYLRKYYHACGNFPGSTSVSDSILGNTAGFTQTQRDAMEAFVADVASLNAANGPWELCSKGGRALTQGQTPECHPFLEHHQLGDAWRGA